MSTGLSAKSEADSLMSKCLSTYADVIAEAVENMLEIQIRKKIDSVSVDFSAKSKSGSDAKAISREADPVNIRGSVLIRTCFSEIVEHVFRTEAPMARMYGCIYKTIS